MGFIDEFRNKYSTGGLQHLSARDIRTEIGEVKFQRYFKFSVVRDPYTKALSQFSYIATRPDLRSFIGMQPEDSLETYLDLIQKREHVQWAPQHTFLYDEQSNLLVDRILRFEKFEKEVSSLFEGLAIHSQVVPHLNKSKVQIGIDSLSRHSLATINAIYEKDFDLFGYSKR
jgi:hypothetical protein